MAVGGAKRALQLSQRSVRDVTTEVSPMLGVVGSWGLPTPSSC